MPPITTLKCFRNACSFLCFTPPRCCKFTSSRKDNRKAQADNAPTLFRVLCVCEAARLFESALSSILVYGTKGNTLEPPRHGCLYRLMCRLCLLQLYWAAATVCVASNVQRTCRHLWVCLFLAHFLRSQVVFFSFSRKPRDGFHATDVIFMNSHHHHHCCCTLNRRWKCVRSMRLVFFGIFFDAVKIPCLHFTF